LHDDQIDKGTQTLNVAMEISAEKPWSEANLRTILASGMGVSWRLAVTLDIRRGRDVTVDQPINIAPPPR